MVKKETKLSTPTVLAFERKFDISDAVFFQKDSEKPESSQVKVSIKEKSVRGTISNRLKKAIAVDPAKLDAEIEKANLQTVDVAILDSDKDTLIVKWSCKVLPFNGIPNVCNNQVYQTKLLEKVREYKNEHTLEELARRYAYNIVNGRWLWRNRLGAENIDICIKYNDGVLNFKKTKDNYTLKEFPEIEKTDFNTLRELIKDGLSGEKFIIFEVESTLKVGYGQEVYPSQELILDKGKSKKSKVLYLVDDNIAGMHSQKIGNAIRTIDTWYPDYTLPIAVEPYGAVTTMGKAFRPPKDDFYNLFDNWLLKDEKPPVKEQHYVMAVLIRGGIFGESGKEK